MTTLRRPLMSWHFAREKFWMSLSRTQMDWTVGGFARWEVAKEFVPEIVLKSLIMKLVATRRRHSHHRAQHPWACPCPHRRSLFLVKPRSQVNCMKTRQTKQSKERDDRGILCRTEWVEKFILLGNWETNVCDVTLDWVDFQQSIQKLVCVANSNVLAKATRLFVAKMLKKLQILWQILRQLEFKCEKRLQLSWMFNLHSQTNLSSGSWMGTI